MQTNDRVERFKSEAGDLKVKAGNAGRDAQLQTLGVVLMVVAVVIAFIAYFGATGADAVGDVLEYVALAVAAVTVGMLGAALFLRYALGKFLRFFLLRQLYEGQAHLDQVVEAIKTK